MENLVKFLTEKIKIAHTLTVLLGFIVVGAMFVFVWNRDIYIELNALQLLLLSIGISFLIFIPNFVLGLDITFEENNDGTEKGNYSAAWMLGTLFTDFEMISGMLLKIYINDLTIKSYITGLLLLFGVIFFIIIIRDFRTWIREYRLKRKK